MSQRAEDLARQFEQAIADLTKTIEECTDAQWANTCGDEKWTVAGTAHHVASQYPLEFEYITAWAENKPVPTYTWDDINAKNEARAAANSKASKADVLSLLRSEAANAANYVRGLSDAQLDTARPLPLANGAEVKLHQLIEGGVLIDHAVAHNTSIRASM